MRIDRGDYRRKKRDKSNALAINIRIQRAGKIPPTRREVIDALQSTLDRGEVPPGWRLAAIDWKNPTKASQGWHSGTLDEVVMSNLRHLIEQTIESAEIIVGSVRR